MKMIFDFAAGSDKGLVRKNNEDNLYLPGAPMKDRNAEGYFYEGKLCEEKAFFCVCDGMGGHNAGEIASDIAANQVQINYRTIIDGVKDVKSLGTVMNGFVSNANMTICGYSDQNAEYSNMGTTMCGIFFLNGMGYCVNVGDSRLYCLHGRKAEQISVDHADPEHTNAITRYLGMPQEYGDVTPDVAAFPVKVNGKKRFLLCSDGLSDMLGDDSIGAILHEQKKPSEAAGKLIEEAKHMGGRDNITVIVIDVKPSSTVIRTVKNPIFAIILAAVLVGGVCGGYVYHRLNAPVEGDALSEVAGSIATARSLNEVQHMLETIPSVNRTKINACLEAHNAVIDASENIINAKAELLTKIKEAETATSIFEEELNNVKKNEIGMSEEELLEKEKSYESWESYKTMIAAAAECEQKKIIMDEYVAAYNAEQEKIKAESNAGKSTSGVSSGGGKTNSGNSSGKGSSNSGKSSSSSGGSSSNSGGSGSYSSGSSNYSGGSSSYSGGSSSYSGGSRSYSGGSSSSSGGSSSYGGGSVSNSGGSNSNSGRGTGGGDR